MRLIRYGLIILLVTFYACQPEETPLAQIKKGNTISLIGNNLCSRMMHYGHFETQVQLTFPDSNLIIRNMCDGGNTPGFRPHSSRNQPWAYEGASQHFEELANPSHSEGHFESEDDWLKRLDTDLIIAFFGYNESFNGSLGISNFKNELEGFVSHTINQNYNQAKSTQLILVSPIAYEDLSQEYDIPNGQKQNQLLELYTNAMEEVAKVNNISFINAFKPSKKWMAGKEKLTIDGSQLNEAGYKLFSQFLSRKLFGSASKKLHQEKVLPAVKEKNWFWHNDFKIPNGVHVYGRRYNPFGPDNYPFEIEKIRALTTIRDTAIWKASKNLKYKIEQADANLSELPEVKTNYKLGKYGTGEATYLYGKDAINTLETAPGFKVELFASEQEFKDLANPVQISFDNKGRLWVAVMPTYPHYKPGDSKPNDKLIILEDTDGDGKADKQTTWADNLHIPVGFELAPEGVYISQGTNLKLLTDTDGDDKADKEEIILSGFDDHDTHHVISAFCADPSGAIFMGEGVFLHSNVETSYGPIRATNGGFFRYAPQQKKLERTAQVNIPNPWGIAFDKWGQNFFAETSGPPVRWMKPSSIKPTYGVGNPKTRNLIEEEHRVRPTSGLEFVSSRHFPEEMQGDLLINNTIGFLGMKQHQKNDQGSGYSLKHRQDLIKGSDQNFRPVDMEFAPDGSLYFIDWHNILIGHMQHNARDPLRDHAHGRVYRITYPNRPLVEPAEIDGADIITLLDNLKLPEYRSRYRSRRELRSRDVQAVSKYLETWIKDLDATDKNYPHQMTEALWVMWGINKIDNKHLEKVLQLDEYKARTAAINVLRYNTHKTPHYLDLFKTAANDKNGRVRLEAMVAASWLPTNEAKEILEVIKKHPLDEWSAKSYEAILRTLYPSSEKDDKTQASEEIAMPEGQFLYQKDGYCSTCHQEEGKGLKANGYPPLANSEWVTGDPDRLIKLTLKGLYGPISVNGVSYPGTVPMTPYEGLMNDEEISAVLTYVRQSFGNQADEITAKQVATIRSQIKGREDFYTPAELLELHPLKSN